MERALLGGLVALLSEEAPVDLYGIALHRQDQRQGRIVEDGHPCSLWHLNLYGLSEGGLDGACASPCGAVVDECSDRQSGYQHIAAQSPISLNLPLYPNKRRNVHYRLSSLCSDLLTIRFL